MILTVILPFRATSETRVFREGQQGSLDNKFLNSNKNHKNMLSNLVFNGKLTLRLH